MRFRLLEVNKNTFNIPQFPEITYPKARNAEIFVSKLEDLLGNIYYKDYILNKIYDAMGYGWGAHPYRFESKIQASKLLDFIMTELKKTPEQIKQEDPKVSIAQDLEDDHEKQTYYKNILRTLLGKLHKYLQKEFRTIDIYNKEYLQNIESAPEPTPEPTPEVITPNPDVTDTPVEDSSNVEDIIPEEDVLDDITTEQPVDEEPVNEPEQNVGQEVNPEDNLTRYIDVLHNYIYYYLYPNGCSNIQPYSAIKKYLDLAAARGQLITSTGRQSSRAKDLIKKYFSIETIDGDKLKQYDETLSNTDINEIKNLYERCKEYVQRSVFSKSTKKSKLIDNPNPRIEKYKSLTYPEFINKIKDKNKVEDESLFIDILSYLRIVKKDKN